MLIGFRTTQPRGIINIAAPDLSKILCTAFVRFFFNRDDSFRIDIVTAKHILYSE